MNAAKDLDRLLQRSKIARISAMAIAIALLYASVLAFPSLNPGERKADIFQDKELEALQGYPLERPAEPPLQTPEQEVTEQ